MSEWIKGARQVCALFESGVWSAILWKYAASHSRAEIVLLNPVDGRWVLHMVEVSEISATLDGPLIPVKLVVNEAGMVELRGEGFLVRAKRVVARQGAPSLPE
ncbi:MAG: hypothetical protein Q8N23_28085 [Archangium sp.]|nr:hypothetical protein [Archangium sp.]MDP3576335.1 hypothetical protein [Archangium sp.]